MNRTAVATAATDLILETFQLNGQLLEAGDRLAAPLGLTSARWQVLGAIEQEGRPLTVAQIGRRMGLTRQAVQRLVNELNTDGFVRLEHNPDHKRARLVALTPMCLARLQTLEEIQTAWANELTDGLNAAALSRAVQLLNDIRERCFEIERRADKP